ncbi:MAG: hypothetical protein JWQ81_2270 [Amycolatopsis sp.]|uniref:putative T7SS-secreted protein n=1 Tax=Amycolatopsis sp. TaxID=37632 RepID=UPI00261D8038|nr:hypothetical protein [Amycolatopsis sp.]MCU1681531.1 hypothetical protein [Amycolatopsis sp.]
MTWDQIVDKVDPLQTANYPALGFDPAPGTVAKVADVAATLGKVATEIGQAYEDLTRLGKADSFWQGDGAQAFQGTVGQVPDYLNKAQQSLTGASGTLSRWADDLGTMQRQAADLERQAEAAQSQVTQAQSNPNLRLAGQTFTDPAQFQQAQDALGQAQQRLTQAQGGLDALRESAKRLLDQHLDLAGQVASALRKAKDEAPEEPGWLDKIGEAIGKMVDGVKNLAGDVWNWVKDHADVIAKIGDVLSKVSAVLGVIAIITAPFEPVGAIFGAAAGLTSVAALGAHGLAKAAGADVSWTTIGLDALGAVPFAASIGSGAKVASAGLKEAGAIGRAADVAGDLGKAGATVKVAQSGKLVAEAGDLGTVAIKGEGLAGRVLVAGESKIINGQMVGTKGLNMLGRITGGGMAVDPLSGLGRGIDAGIGGTKIVGGQVYQQLTDDKGNPPAPAAQTFSGRLAGRAAS